MREFLRQLKFRTECAVSPRLRKLYHAEPDRAVLEELRWQVVAGPFTGMRYISNACGSRLAPKLLGTYERELHPGIEAAIAKGYDRIIDIGCAEGYYAVGLAMRTGRPVTAYDNHPAALECLKELADLNDAGELIDGRASCTHDSFSEFIGQEVLVICDIEGAEAELLDPQRAPALIGFDLLVEIHDGEDSTRIHDEITRRFGDSHHIESIRYRGRTASDAARLSWISNPSFRLAAVDERRIDGLEWLLMLRHD